MERTSTAPKTADSHCGKPQAQPPQLHNGPGMNCDDVAQDSSQIGTSTGACFSGTSTTYQAPTPPKTSMLPRSPPRLSPETLPTFSMKSPASNIVGTPFSELHDAKNPFEYPFPPTSVSSSGVSSPPWAMHSNRSNSPRSFVKGSAPGLPASSPIRFHPFSKSSSELPELLYHSPPVSSDKICKGNVSRDGRRSSGSSLHPQMKWKDPPIPPSLREKLKRTPWHSVGGGPDSPFSFVQRARDSSALDSDDDSDQEKFPDAGSSPP